VKIKQIHVSELGLRLDDLAAGLNVIYGPENSGKTTVARFAQAVLYGLADPSLRFLAPRQGEAVGAVTLTGPRGSETLSRVNDGSQRGELTLESRSAHDYEDYYNGHYTSHRHQPDLINHHYDAGEHIAARWVGGIDEAEFAAVYAVEFPREYSLDRLVDVTLARGADEFTTTYTGGHYYEYAATTEEEIHLNSLDANVQQLETRRHDLTVELEELQRNAAALHHEAVTARGRLQDQIAAIEHDQQSRTAELHRVEAEIRRVEEEIAQWWSGIRSENEAASRYASSCVEFLNQQIDHLQTSRNSLQSHADHLEDQMSHPTRRDDYYYDADGYSADLERKAHEIDRELSSRRSATTRWSSEWRRDDAYTRLTPVLETLQSELTSLAQHVRSSGRQIQDEGLHCELHHAQAKIDETTRQIERLTAQRHYICDRMEPVDVHNRGYDAQRRETLERERLHDLRSHASQLSASLHAANAELDSLRAELNRIERSHRDAHRNRIEHCRTEISRVAAQVRQAVIAREDFADSLNRRVAPRKLHPVAAEASRNLHRLTGGELVRVSIDRDSRSIRVEDNTGMQHHASVLSAGSRDLVKLSLCLALASDRARRQQPAPLLLDDAFRHLPSHCHRAAAELLCDYASNGWQVVLLTSQREVAELMKSYGAPVRNLPVRAAAPVVRNYPTSQRPREYRRTSTATLPEYAWHGALPHHYASKHRTHVHSRPAPASRPLPQPLAEPRRAYDDSYALGSEEPMDYPHAAPQPSYYGVRQYDRSLPVFSRKIRYTASQPYHLHRDTAPLRSHRQYESASPKRQETQHVDGYFLRTPDEVTAIPFLEPAVANQLRDLGVYTVADLMHANAGELATQVSRPGVKHSTVSRWQGMARLMCEVRNLRSYDARILYACRIYDGQQLASIQPGDLQSILEDFVATPDGSRLVRSGSTAEIDRLTRWINGGGASAWRNRPRNSQPHSEAYEGLHTSDDDYTHSRDNGARNYGYSNGAHSNGAHSNDGHSNDGHSNDGHSNDGHSNGSRSSSSRGYGSHSSGARTGSSNGSSQSSRSSRSSGSSQSSTSRSRRSSTRTTRDNVRSERSSREREARRAERRRARRERELQAEAQRAREEHTREQRAARTSQRSDVDVPENELRFYLSREQEVTAAPSIGPKTADRLQSLGIYTVDDLLRADAEDVAARMNHRRIKASHIRDWQHQAELVCCTPRLRGHDAQILVACGVTTAAQLAVESASALYGKVKPFCQTKEGIRIVRNGKKPDLAEVHEWISAAADRRQLAAA